MEKMIGKKIAIIGFGIEGIAVAEYLSSQGVDNYSILDFTNEETILAKIESESDQEKAKKYLSDDRIEKRLGEGYLDNLNDFDLIVRSPGISFFNEKIQEAKRSGKEITSQIKMFFDLCPAKIIGVSGTKGKGTTSSLICSILKKNFKSQISNLKSNQNDQWQMANDKFPQVYLAGNIGYPALTLLPKIKAEDYVILELSSFQLMDLHKSPHIAVVTNLTVDHLDYHQDIAEYQNAKKHILRYQNEKDFAVLNADSTYNSGFLNELTSNLQFFSSNLETAEAFVNDNKVILKAGENQVQICDETEIQLFGRHNLENIAAAALVANILEVDLEIIKASVREFRGLPHRTESAGEIKGTRFINDSFATNPEPTMAAIDSFSEDKVLVLGGSSKGADFDSLAQKITQKNVKAVVLIGIEGERIKEALVENKYTGIIAGIFSDLKEAVSKSLELSEGKAVVVFSPACASFDMFKNYKDRGNKFKQIVTELKEENA